MGRTPASPTGGFCFCCFGKLSFVRGRRFAREGRSRRRFNVSCRSSERSLTDPFAVAKTNSVEVFLIFYCL